jgi:hypothetical protein
MNEEEIEKNVVGREGRKRGDGNRYEKEER